MSEASSQDLAARAAQRDARHKTKHRGVTFRETDRGRSYYVTWGGKYKLAGTTQQAALDLQAALRARKARGERVVVVSKRRVREVAEEWFAAEQSRWRIDYRREMRRCLDKEILPEFGDDLIASLGPQEIIAYDRKLRARGLSESGAANVQKPLRGLLDHGVLCGDLSANPFRQLGKGKVSSSSTRRRHHEWSDDQIAKFIATARAFDERKTARRKYADQIETMIECGLRIAEASGLRFSDIETEVVDDEERHVLVVQRQLSKRGEVHEYVKTSSSRRRIPITRQLHDRLRFRQSLYALGEGDFIFAERTGGRPPSHSNFRRRAWHPIVAETGLALDPDTKILPHDSRHIAASRLGQKLNSDHVAMVLGHRDARTTETIYQHVWGRSDKEQRVRAAMDALGGGA